MRPSTFTQGTVGILGREREGGGGREGEREREREREGEGETLLPILLPHYQSLSPSCLVHEVVDIKLGVDRS